MQEWIAGKKRYQNREKNIDKIDKIAGEIIVHHYQGQPKSLPVRHECKHVYQAATFSFKSVHTRNHDSSKNRWTSAQSWCYTQNAPFKQRIGCANHSLKEQLKPFTLLDSHCHIIIWALSSTDSSCVPPSLKIERFRCSQIAHAIANQITW